MMTSDGIAQNGTRIPPHNLEIEQSLLGAMLLRQEAIGTAVETVSASDFYNPAHGHIYEAICSLWASGEAIDAATVADELRRAGLLDLIGGPNTIVHLISAAPRPPPPTASPLPPPPRPPRATPAGSRRALCSASSSAPPARSPTWATR